ncbi:MAG: hypothetical protein COX63_00810 [Candidatus Diapherotrites archaeon CG_4_10_14_0_2_um_filter_31_5]|nr:MAG: hypothetical protein COX63_00810 [Candidatus Diapherotrites archaeon CG_4_10_14_0_2_um_filter_31_5]
MVKSDFPKKSRNFPVKLVLIFVIGLVVGAVIQLMFIQSMLDNSPSFKSGLAECESSRNICDSEVQNYFECMQSNNLNPNTDCS